MTTIELNGKTYFDINYVANKNPNFTRGCVNTNKVILKHKIPTDAYVFVSLNKKNGYTILPNDTNYKARKMLILKEWIDEYNVTANLNSSNNLLDSSLQSLPDLPDLLEIDDEEKFKDAQGNVIDIIVRGERDPYKIYFKAKDIGEMLNIERIKDSLNCATSEFVENVHYVYFNNVHKSGEKDTKSNNNKVTYLTYKGLLRMLFVRRHPIADHFVDWAINVLFRAHLGTQEQKTELVAQVKGMNLEAVVCMFNANVNAMPVVYLIQLGQAKNIREKLNLSNDIPDEAIIFKYGLSKDGRKRFEQHIRTFRLMGLEPELKYYTHVDPIYLSQAEIVIKRFFVESGWNVQHELTELGYLTPKLIHLVENSFKFISTEYAGKIKDMQSQLECYKSKYEEEKRYCKQICDEKDKRLEENKKIYEDNKKVNEEVKEIMAQYIKTLQAQISKS